MKEKCSLCGSTKIMEMYPSNIDLKKLSFTYVKTPDSNKTFRVLRCKKCTHVFCSPIPKDIYKNYEDVVDNQYLKYTQSLKISANKILPIIKKYKNFGKILDVGCATGEFLEEAKKYGFEIEGLELSKWSSEIAKKKGILIHRQKLKYLSRKFPNKYDVITLFGVIEHFEYPVGEMESINKLLKTGGILVIWTGDVDSIPSRILKKNWWYWQGQHIQYFSDRSINYLGKKSGFRHIKTAIYPFVATYELMNNYLGRYYLRPWLMKFIRPFFMLKPTWAFYIPGEMLWFGEKNEEYEK